MTSCFEIIENNINNTIRGNIAAGSERLGFWLAGDSCDQSPALFSNNTAHSCLAGMLLIANSRGAACTKVTNFTTYLNWDFGIITMKGIETHVTLQDVVVAGRTILALQQLAAPVMFIIKGYKCYVMLQRFHAYLQFTHQILSHFSYGMARICWSLLAVFRTWSSCANHAVKKYQLAMPSLCHLNINIYPSCGILPNHTIHAPL